VNPRHRAKWRSLYVWHRWLGVFAALPLMWVAATGLLLNHTEDLDLDGRRVESPWLLDWYGISAPRRSVAYPLAADRWLVWMDGRLFLAQRPLDTVPEPPLGAVQTEGLLVVAVPEALYLYTLEGEAVEVMRPAHGLPVPIAALGSDGSGGVVLRRTDGTLWLADGDLVAWRPAEGAAPAVHWSHPETPPEALRQGLLRAWRGEGLKLERVVLDLHSGRLFGTLGVWVVDASALLVLALAPTGLVLWWRALRRRRA